MTDNKKDTGFIPMDAKVTSIAVTTPHLVTDAGDVVGRELQLALTLEGRVDPLIITTRQWIVPNRSTHNSTRYLWLNGEEWESGGVLEERASPLGEEMATVCLAHTRPPTHGPEVTYTVDRGVSELLEVLEELGMRKGPQ
jgi:hypothetical protein